MNIRLLLIKFFKFKQFLVWIALVCSTSHSLALSNAHTSFSDSLNSHKIAIDNIFILGNKKTKEKIIHRELDFQIGDSLSRDSLDFFLEAARNRIFNIRLFVTVSVEPVYLTDSIIDIIIKVKERFYTFPAPLFRLADRNFNVWWTDQNKDFSRTEYGIKFYQYNVRGLNERLRLIAQFGYTRLFDIDYHIPYINKAQKNGIRFSVNYSENKNTPYTTENNKREFFDSENLLRQAFSARGSFIHRESFYNLHTFHGQYNYTHVADTIVKLNPGYFDLNEDTQQYFSLTYQFIRDLRDIRNYALKGLLFEFSAQKQGLGIFDDINQFNTELKFARFIDLRKGFYFTNRSVVKASFPRRQPYNQFQGLGYKEDLVRGYELNVIDGQHFLLNKTEFKKRLFSKQFTFNFIPIDQFRTVPTAMYVKTFFDAGYVDSQLIFKGNAPLSNEVLYSWGIGLDFVTYYDSVTRLEYTINSQGNGAMYLHFRTDI